MFFLEYHDQQAETINHSLLHKHKSQTTLSYCVLCLVCHFNLQLAQPPFFTTKVYFKTPLVGGLNPSEKYESQLGLLFPIYGNIKNGNQTTNQTSIQQHAIEPGEPSCQLRNEDGPIRAVHRDALGCSVGDHTGHGAAEADVEALGLGVIAMGVPP